MRINDLGGAVMSNYTKRIVGIIITILVCLIPINMCFSADNDIPAEELHIMDKYPGILWNGMTLLPMKPFLEGLGLTVEWYEKEKLIVASGGFEEVTVNKYKKDDGTIYEDKVYAKEYSFKLQINNKYAMVGLREVYSKVPPVIYQGQTFVPCRFIAEEMGATVNWEGEDDVYITIPGTPNKSFVFPINTRPDLKQLPKLPQPKILDSITAGDVSVNNSLGKDATKKLLLASGQYPSNDDWNYLNSRLSSIFETIPQNSDMALTLVKDNVRDKCGNYLHIYMPLRKDQCEELPNQSGEFAGWYQEQRIASIVGVELAPIAKTIYLMCLNQEFKPGLWERYSDGIKVTLVSANNIKLTVVVPFEAYKIDKTTMYRPQRDSKGNLLKTYKIYINGKFLGIGTDNNNWNGSCGAQIKSFLQHPVTKPINPYFDVVNYPYNMSLYEQGIRQIR
jgi:hypothetical protein